MLWESALFPLVSNFWVLSGRPLLSENVCVCLPVVCCLCLLQISTIAGLWSPSPYLIYWWLTSCPWREVEWHRRVVVQIQFEFLLLGHQISWCASASAHTWSMCNFAIDVFLSKPKHVRASKSELEQMEKAGGKHTDDKVLPVAECRCFILHSWNKHLSYFNWDLASILANTPLLLP